MPFEKVQQLLSTNAKSLRALARVAGQDPATFYRDANLGGADLRSQDLRGMSLDRADLSGVRVDAKTKADTQVLKALRYEAIQASEVRLREGLPTAEFADTVGEIVELYLAMDELALAEGYLQQLLTAGLRSWIGSIDPFVIANSKLPSAEAFLSTWFQSVTHAEVRHIRRLARSVSTKWPHEATDWVSENIELLQSETVIDLIKHDRVRPDAIADWLAVEGRDAQWRNVAAWGLVAAQTDMSARRRIMSAIAGRKSSRAEELLLSLMLALGGRPGEPIGFDILGSGDIVRLGAAAVGEASLVQLAALEKMIKGLQPTKQLEKYISSLLRQDLSHALLLRRRGVRRYKQLLLWAIARRRRTGNIRRLRQVQPQA